MPDSRPKLFLSYARGDDEPFVKRLYQRLCAEGFSVWWDRECMPSRALTFLKEIREAVRAADRTVVVIGPKCVASDYCRAEWQAALAEARVVNPLLRLGDRQQVPPELSSLHCPSFCDDARFEDSFRETLRVLSEPIPPLGALAGGVPDVPPHFQPRPDDFSSLAGRILIDEKRPVTLTGPQRVTVLHGMGGGGKSVLAATFARSTSTRRSFADGVFWLPAGERATPLALTTELGRLLGDAPSAHTDLATAKNLLANALADRSVLVVLDDAWHVAQLEPFIDALGPSGRLLVTTRLGELATATGATAVELGMLSPQAAAQHLADWSGVTPDALPAEAHEVAKECGYLPFALALNGAMHLQGVTWTDLLQALRTSEIDYAEQRLKGYPYPTVLKSIKVSMDALDAEDAAAGARLRELAAFQPDAGTPEAAVAILWGHTAASEARHVSKMLTRLAGKALLRLEGQPPARRVVLHDLQRDYLARVTDPSALNDALLDAYHKTCGGDWPRLPADGYVHRHLIQHLLAADRSDEIRALLNQSTSNGGNAWFAANDALDNAIGYLADLDRLEPGREDEALALHLLLLRTSVETTLRRIPPPLHAALLSAGRTTGSNALASVRRIGDPEKRVSAMLELVPELAEAERGPALAECLATVRGRGNQVRARILPLIARHFTGNERTALAEEALQAARGIEIPEYRAAGLAAVLAILDGPARDAIVPEAASALEESVDLSTLSSTIAAVLPFVPTLAATLLEKARALGEPFLTAMAFSAIVPHLPEAGRASAAREGIACFEAARSNGLWIVVSLARHIPGFDLDALILRAATEDQRQLPHLVAALPGMLSGSALQSALQRVAEAAENFAAPNGTKTKISLLDHFDEARRTIEVQTLLREIPTLRHDSWRRDAYLLLLAHLQRDQLIEVRTQMARLDDAGDVLASAAFLASSGDEALRLEVFERVKVLPASREKFAALVSLAQSREDAHHRLVLDSALALRSEIPQWTQTSQPMLALLPLLPPAERAGMLETAVVSALQVSGFVAEEEFIKLLSVLPEAVALDGFRNLLATAERLAQHQQQYWANGPQVSENSSALADTLARLAPHLPEALLSDCLAAVQRLSDSRWRAVALGHLLPRLDFPRRAPVLRDVLALDPAADPDEQFRVAACRAMAHAISALDGDPRTSLENRLQETLGGIDASWIPGLIKEVAPALSATDLEALAKRALAKPNIYTPLSLSRIAPPAQRWTLLLGSLEEVRAEECKNAPIADVLNETVAALLNAPDEVREQAWQAALRQLRGDRNIVARYLTAVAPLGASLHRRSVLAAAARSLLAVQAWWP
ncbi:MAG: TIR domain-containing protein [Chthoniobacteraceae bacterium]